MPPRSSITGEIDVYRKIRLPNYEVFDENRYFDAGREPLCRQPAASLGINICEDIWEAGDSTGIRPVPS